MFLVEPIIPHGGIVVLHGPKTAGKTQLALTLGIAVAQGTTFLGEYACRQGPVVFLETDMTVQTLQSRVRLAEGTKRLLFLHAEPFDIVKLAATAPLPDAVVQAQQRNPALVIVDSLRKTNVGDEISSATPSRVFAAWKRLFPHATLLFIHHDRKKPRDPEAFLHAEEAARGTGAWLDDADTGLHLTRVRGNHTDGHVCSLTFSKCRTTEEPPALVLKMHEDSLLVEPTKPSTRQAVWAWRQAHPQATKEEAREWFLGQKLGGRSLAYRLIGELWGAK